MDVPYVPRSSAERMTTSGPVFWSFGRKPQNFIDQEEWRFRPQRSTTQIPITDGLRVEITMQRRCIEFTTHEMNGKPCWASSYPQSNPNEVISGGMGPSPRQCYKATYKAIQGKPLKRGFSVEAQFGFTEEVKSELRSLWGDETNITSGNCTKNIQRAALKTLMV